MAGKTNDPLNYYMTQEQLAAMQRQVMGNGSGIYFFNGKLNIASPKLNKPTNGTNNTMANRKFNDNDTVLTTKAQDSIPEGTSGTVRGYDGSSYAVSFPELESDPDFKGSLHDCNGFVPNEDGYWFTVNNLELYVKPKVDFDSVVIEDEKRAQILEALEQINQQDLIFKTWGFAGTIEKGRGVSLLFHGPPGTGKTLMAQAIADKLDYKLKVISTADIQSGSPGESERNIRKHFKEAKNGKTILLFDECDSLIYTRTGVGPILGAQINELLSQIERYRGITVFTTNRLGTLDEAMNRRLALKLEFAMPSPEQREKIWKRMFPENAPLAKDVNWTRLAGVELTGGYIKNAVLRAARKAAVQDLPDADKTITQDHLVTALAEEARSMMEFDKARKEHESRGLTPNGVVSTRDLQHD